MAVGDLYSVRAQYTFLAEEMENTFFYEQTLGSLGAIVLGASFAIDIVPFMQAVMHTAASFVQIVVVNLDDPTDFFTTAHVAAGGVGGEAMPPFTSWGFTRFSSDRRIRSGGIRVGGLSELSVNAGVADPGTLINLQTLAGEFASPVENPVLSDRWALRLHTDGNLATAGLPLTVPVNSVSYRRVTTQSTRKFSF